jgi:uncharacterized protein YodC (DUF2158 family)
MEIGNVVMLKSGGPEMTVKNIVGETTNETETYGYTSAGFNNGDVVCQWFGEKNKVESVVFNPRMLDLCVEND